MGKSEQRVKAGSIQAQGTAIAVAIASICKDGGAHFGVRFRVRFGVRFRLRFGVRFRVRFCVRFGALVS